MTDKSIPLSFAAMTKEQLDAELRKCVDYIKTGRVYSADEFASLFVKKFGILDMRYNKLTNLIPIINPGLSGESGIRAAILYRMKRLESCIGIIMEMIYRNQQILYLMLLLLFQISAVQGKWN